MSIYAEKRSGRLTGTFIVEVEEDGNRMRARAKSMAEAKQIEKDMQRGRWEAPADPKSIRVTFLSLSELIKTAKLQRPRVKNSWRVDRELEYVESLLGADLDVEKIASGTLTDLAKRIVVERGCSNATANRYLYALCGLLSWARAKDLMVRAPVYEKLDEGNSGRTRWLTQEQEHQIMKWLHQNGRTAEAVCVEVLGQTGLRSGELCSLKLDQIDTMGGLITLMDQKDGTGEEGVPIDPRTASLLAETIFRGQMPSKTVLLKWFKKAAKACGLPVGRGKDGLVVHSLRHSTATRLIRAGVNPAEVQSYMRHKSWATTQRYVKITGEQKRKALETLRNAGENLRGISGSQRETVSTGQRKAEEYQVFGAQGRNRTTDTAIFSPGKPTPNQGEK